MKAQCLLVAMVMLWVSAHSVQARSPASLDELLDQLRQVRVEEAEANRAREMVFLAEKESQEHQLAVTKDALKAEEKRSEELHLRLDANEKRIAELKDTLSKGSGRLLELFGVTREVAGDASAMFRESLISTQNSERIETVAALARSKSLPAIEELEELWFALLEEMTESGKVVAYRANVVGVDGIVREKRVTRVGTFTAVSGGQFLRHIPQTGQFIELSRQPPVRHRRVAAELEQSSAGLAPMVIDPSRGAVLSLLVKVPDLLERLKQGRLVGYVIIGIALIGLLVAVERFVYLSIVGRRMVRQIDSPRPDPRNPLGRVLAVYEANRHVVAETLELKIDQAILNNLPSLQRGLQTLRVLAVIAPLLGLLGTVTGLIETFQSITLFGTGDPRLMAGGISQALVTTVLGLTAAIPLILLHSTLASSSRRMVCILEEQSAGIIATHAERREGYAATA